MGGLRIQLFGEFRVWRDGVLIGNEEWGRQKTRSLLKLLLTRPGRAFSRDEILEALWPGSSPKAAERSLWVTVSLLRRALEPALERGSDSSYVLQRRPGYMFKGEDCEVDAWEFREHQRTAEAAHEAGENDIAISEYRRALRLLGGEYLAEEPYEEWAAEAREEWRERHLNVLSGLSECLALRGRYTEAIEFCNRALALDKYSENLNRQLMLYHYCAGEQAPALQAYRDYAGRLAEELGAAPSPELARLKDRIEVRDVPGVDELQRYPRPRRPLKLPYSLSRTHFVGRDGEYALLAERLRETMEGRGGAVALEGEAGVGKTRLAEEFLGYARSRGALVLSGRCYERELGAPLEPVVEAIGRVTDVDELISGILHSGGEEPGYPGGADPHERTRVYRTLAGELIQRSHDDHEGLVLFVDDLQWADPATPEFLSYLARRVTGEKVLLVVSYRREHAAELSGWLDSLAERRALTTLSLDRLSREDTAEFLSRMASRGFDGLGVLAEFLQRESEGNPFYAVEYLRWLIEAGAVRVDSRRRISELEREALREGILPSGVQSLIQARLGGLDDRSRELLEFAAVVGRGFDLDLLCEAAARGEAETFALIKPLLASGLVVETPTGAYHFSHDKLRQALYGNIDSPQRRELHLRVAETLEEAKGEPAELAHHYLRARAWRPALDNLVLAARRAEESYAWQTALENYGRALEVTKELPDSGMERFDLLMARERLLEHMDRREERAETAREMFELAKHSGDQGQIAEVHVRRIGALAALSDPAGAEEAGQAAIAIFQELEDRAGEARAQREMGYVRWKSRDYAGALEANFRALGIHRELGDRRGEAGDAHNITQAYRGMGDYEQALYWAGEATGIYQELEDRQHYDDLRAYTMGSIHLDRGDLEAALHLSLKALRFNVVEGRKNIAATFHSRCGTLYLRLGDPKEALEHFREAARLNREVGSTRDEGYSLASVGMALEQDGNPAGAADACRQAVELLQAAYEEFGILEDLSGRADALNLLASTLHRSPGDPAEALDAYEAAARIYRKLGDTAKLRKLLLGFAGLLWRTGGLEESARDYEEALELAREHGETADEAAALASLSVVHRDRGRLRESLRSGREARRLLRSDLADPQSEAYVLTSLAESYERLGHYPSALSCLKRSLRLRRKIGDKKGEVGVLRYLTRIYDKLGDAAHAQASQGEAVRKEEMLEDVSLARKGDK